MHNLKNLPLYSKPFIKIVLSVMIFILIGYLFINAYLNKINHSGEAQAIPPSEEFFETDSENNDNDAINQHNVFWDEDKSIISDKNIINIMLIGQDKRPGESRARSDSMIIATINKNSNTIKLTSLMRDMYVQIPGYSDNKINAAYAFGGIELLSDTVEKNFLVHIDGSVEVDFSGFTKIIDKIGGVDIVLNEAEAEYLNDSSNLNFRAGLNNLAGENALTYSRIRYIGNDDYERTERQRKVLTSVFDKFTNSSITKLLDIADEILPLITTDLSNSQILGLLTETILNGVSDLETYRIPADGEYTPTTINGMSVLLPNLTENRALLKEYIGYGK